MAVVGASLAGATTATLLARAGARVALVERQPDPNAYKVDCAHLIRSSGMPTIRRLGLEARIDAAGGVHTTTNVWTRWGWIVPPEGAPPGYNARRQTLEPMLRRLAADTPGVALMTGEKVTGLVEGDDAVAGVRTFGADSRERVVRARLVVGADGVHSTVAQRAGAKARTRENERFAFFAYFRGVGAGAGTRSQMWLRDPDVAYALPNADGVSVLACMPTKAQLSAFKRDPAGALVTMHRQLPDGPRLEGAERVSEVIGTADHPLVSRPPVPWAGAALVGDAALASDPTWGVGCAWALQSGEWLADEVAPALAGDRPMGAALRRYAQRHRVLASHHRVIADYASSRALSGLERLVFSAGARDAKLAAHVEAVISRRVPARRLTAPGPLARALWVNARRADREGAVREYAGAERT